MTLVDGSFHTVDSSELAFKLAGSMAMKQALEQASPVLLEPIMLVTLSVPEETIGDVIGDLNSRRGRPQGMERIGAMAEIKAEVPMAELLGYAPDLRSITGGQGDYTMEFLRYEEVPGHLVSRVLESRQEGGAGARLSARRRGRVPRETSRDAKMGAGWLRARCRRAASPSRARSAAARCCGASLRRRSATAPRSTSSASCARGARSARAGCARARRSPIPRARARRGRARSSGGCARGSRTGHAGPGDRSFFPAESSEGLGHERHIHAVPSDTGGQLGRAVTLFNACEHVKLLAGVIRSLGAPHVQLGAVGARSSSSTSSSPGSCAGTASRPTSTARSCGGERAATSSSELGAALGEPNAAADPDGRLALAPAVPPRSAFG